MALGQFPYPPETWGDEKEQSRKLALAVRGLLDGKSNNLKDVTLEVDAAVTTISSSQISADTRIFLVPLTANAAAAQATTYVTTTAGVATITHDSDATTDRTFGIALFG